MKKNYFILLFTIMLGYSSSAQLIINEILYDPPSGLAGDTNGDGARDSTEDEFIEFINTSAANLDVSGYKIFDFKISNAARTLRHTIPSGTIIPPNGALVVFGGGTPVGAFGGAVVVADIGTAGLSMNNSGEKIQVENASGTQILEFDSDALSNNPDESYTRDPDVTGAFVQHAGIVAAAGALFSPGTSINGTAFNTVLSTNQFEKNSFSIYPNPVTNGTVNISSNSSEAMTISVFDVLGKLVSNQRLTSNQPLNVSSLKSGMYILKITQNNATTSKKLVVK